MENATVSLPALAPLTASLPGFTQPDIAAHLEDMSAEELDQLPFGVIGFDDATDVRAYNASESRAAGLRPDSVLARPLFKVVAPCMNNFMVAQRFEDAEASSTELDAVIDYVLTLRMRPVKVRLRLLAVPGARLRYVLVNRDA